MVLKDQCSKNIFMHYGLTISTEVVVTFTMKLT